MKIIKYFVLIAAMLIVKSSFSQIETYKHFFVSPLKIEPNLAGNFAEPRSRHFHTGIDYKTYSDGQDIIAVADGYVSRVLVSPWGYGMAIYMNHPNGYTSVYGHLSKFTPELEEFVTNLQYLRKSFAVDTSLSEAVFSFKKGETIAYSGNTGMSEGPHLHFELRETESKHPVNTVASVYDFKDNVKPEIASIIIYPLSENSRINNGIDRKLIKLKKKEKGNYYTDNNINVTGLIGIGVAYVDRMNDSHNRYGARSVKLFVNDELIYHSEIDELSFDKQRCKNSMFDYSYFLYDKLHVHKLFIEPNNDLLIYNYSVNDGMFAIDQNEKIAIKIEIVDYNGNKSYANFYLNGVENNVERCINPNAKLKWDEDNILLQDMCRVDIDSACLFCNTDISFEKIGDYKYSAAYKVGKDDIALKNDFTISFFIDEDNLKIKDKLFIARIQNDRFTYLKPTVSQNYISASASYFGEFYLWVDTTAPKITPKNIRKDKNMKSSRYIEVEIADDYSGIYDYDMYINDVWVLGEYFPRKRRVRYYFDEKMPVAKKYEFKMIVEDSQGNVAEYSTNFLY